MYLVFEQDDDDESDDSELSDFDLDETTLETYLTPIDDEDCDNPIDEYITFQEVINRKLNMMNLMKFLNSCNKRTNFMIFNLFHFFI